MGINVEHVSRRFGTFQALDDVTLDIDTGSLVALLGPSGSGKSTLLRMIAGLDQPDSGRIWLTGRDATHESVQDRRVGFVFQHYALFKHMTVRQNIGFGLTINQWPKARIKQRVDELLELVQLQGLGNRYPAQLSGGQRQRVALARSLAIEPKVLLLDEPFGALDTKVRKELRDWLRRLHDEVHVTTVLVTHDQEEAMEISDRIVVMNQGRIEQIGSPAEIYDHPATPFVMEFIGPVNVLTGSTPLVCSLDGTTPPESVARNHLIYLRPHDVMISPVPDEGTVPATVDRIVHLGWEIQVDLMIPDRQRPDRQRPDRQRPDRQRIMAHLSRERFDQLHINQGQTVFVKAMRDRTFSLPIAV